MITSILHLDRAVCARFLLAAFLFLTPMVADAMEVEMAGGGKVVWARLKTPSPSWNRHAKSDYLLLNFIHNSTSLDIDPAWHAADVDNLDQMSAYPFLFCEGLGYVDEAGRKNLSEYIQRGGFLFIDSCIAPDVNPREDDFITTQMAALHDMLPDMRTEPIPPDHAIFHNCFNMVDGLPNTRIDDPADWPIRGLTAIYSKNRLVCIMSVSGLQCGWAGIIHSQEHCTNCMKMMINIYFYAITH
jgi:hypothetical protein